MTKKPDLPLLATPDVSTLSLSERCAYYAQQIADYEADICGRVVLDLTDIRAVLTEASAAIAVGGC